MVFFNNLKEDPEHFVFMYNGSYVYIWAKDKYFHHTKDNEFVIITNSCINEIYDFLYRNKIYNFKNIKRSEIEHYKDLIENLLIKRDELLVFT